MKKIYLLLFSAILFIGILAGCGNSEDNADKSKDKTDNTKTEQTDEASFPVTVTDGNGDNVTIEEEPERIVSVIPSDTEIAYALGLGDQIVGVSDHDDYPKEAAEKEKVGGMELNVEKILSLDPQLVLADQSNDEKALKQINEAGIPVVVVASGTNFDEVYDAISLIGQATGAQDKAKQIVGDMKEKLTALEDKAKAIGQDEQKKVYVEISPSPDIYTPGKNTFMDELLSIIHAENATGDQDGWVKINEEQAITSNPDVIITTYGSYVEDPVAEVAKRSGWEDVKAVKNKQIFDINEDLVSRPGPRLVNGVEELGKVIYPEVFDD
ncbi:ABC transporter substrate-binding protein [Lentibacillus sp. N15]|uniref:ABC transporter substrate-binding protein n=1 Tax=Lentibacillus songyuanensis TaxID=3136161 RepID=UPI0031BAC7BD